MMIEAATIMFQDADSLEEAAVIDRYDNDQVALCISFKSGGDFEVVMIKADAIRLMEGLEKTLRQI